MTFEQRMIEATQRRSKLERDILNGNVKGRVFGGVVKTETPKGIQVWYTTRQLVDMVTARMDSSERANGIRRCHINSTHQLQIRGKHLRRLMKAMPNLVNKGRMLYEET